MRNIDKLIKETKELIKENEKYDAMQIDYVLVANMADIFRAKVVASNANVGVIITVSDDAYKLNEIPDWDFNFDNYLFEFIEEGYSIGNMSMLVHYNVWCYIEQSYQHDDIFCEKGMNWYLDYCRKTGVTKNALDNEIQLNVPNAFEIVHAKQRIPALEQGDR